MANIKRTYTGELIKMFLITSSEKINTFYMISQYLNKIQQSECVQYCTRSLFTEITRELYEEDRKMYYVCGEGPSLHICRADSYREWAMNQEPYVMVHGEIIDFNDFEIFVYESFNRLLCGKGNNHDSESVTIKTRDRLGNDVSFNVFHCNNCGKYYTNIDSVKNKFKLAVNPFVRFNFLNYGSNLDYRRDESELTMYGYNARADGLTETERLNLLSKLLFYKCLSKETIIKILRNNINFNGSRPNMQNAVRIWKSDIEYVQNYGLNRQKHVKTEHVNLRKNGKLYRY